MKLCPICQKPLHAKHFCMPVRQAIRLKPVVSRVVHAPVVHRPSPNKQQASPNTVDASPNKGGSRNARWRAKNAEAYRAYMRAYMARKRAAER
jgi:hypothetical protein